MSANYYNDAARANERLHQARMAYTSTTEPLYAIKKEIADTRKSIIDVCNTIAEALNKIVNVNEELRRLSDERDLWKSKAESLLKDHSYGKPE